MLWELGQCAEDDTGDVDPSAQGVVSTKLQEIINENEAVPPPEAPELDKLEVRVWRARRRTASIAKDTRTVKLKECVSCGPSGCGDKKGRRQEAGYQAQVWPCRSGGGIDSKGGGGGGCGGCCRGLAKAKRWPGREMPRRCTRSPLLLGFDRRGQLHTHEGPRRRRLFGAIPLIETDRRHSMRRPLIVLQYFARILVL